MPTKATPPDASSAPSGSSDVAGVTGASGAPTVAASSHAPAGAAHTQPAKGVEAGSPVAAADFPVIIVTGLSGAGKSTVLNVLEDLRYFTVDGLPATLAPQMVTILNREALAHYQGLVLGMDLRESNFVRNLEKTLERLQGMGVRPAVVFIEANAAVLNRRYATTRRPHPLESEGMGLEQALEQERLRLAPVRETADLVVDTSSYSIHDLRRVIQKKWSSIQGRIRALRINIVTFGFKYGVPTDADLVFDLRFLPNPYFVPDLRPLSGLDEAVAKYVLEAGHGDAFLAKLVDFLHFLLPQYETEGRYRLTLAFGCTGGRHRSVSVAEALLRALKKSDYAVSIEHRHMELG